MRYPALAIAVLIVAVTLSGCQTRTGGGFVSHAPSSNPQILVLVPQKNFVSSTISAKRYASAKEYARVPIHLRRQIDHLAKDNGLKEVGGWPIEVMEAYCVVFELSADQQQEEILRQLSREPKVLFAQPMHYFKALAAAESRQDDPYAQLQFGEDLANLRQLHQHGMGESIQVGVLDSAVDHAHPDLIGQIKSSIDFVPALTTRDKLHGTALAGIISAQVNNGEGGFGFAPDAELFVYGVCGPDRNGATVCSTLDLARGLVNAMKDNVNIINLSLAGPHDPLLELLLRDALRKDMIIIAADNYHHPKRNFPASLPGVIAVRESTREAGLRHTSNRKLIADPWYRRKERMSTRAGGGYQFFYGTSIPTAAITGLAALIHGHYSPPTTRQWLEVATSGDCESRPSTPPTEQFSAVLSRALGCNEDGHSLNERVSPRHGPTGLLRPLSGIQ